jgi:hypothetical protein
MKLHLIGGLAAFALASAAIAQTATQPELVLGPRSLPGWSPSPAIQRQVAQTAQGFLADRYEGRLDEAYGRLAQAYREASPRDKFDAEAVKFNKDTGALLGQRIVRVLWAKNPTGGVPPGVYATVNLVDRFMKADRHCVRIALYQPPLGGPFEITVAQSTQLTNAEARKLAKDKPDVSVDDAWKEMSVKSCKFDASAVKP